MAGRSYRGLRRSVAVVACLVGTVALLTGSPAAGTVPRGPLRVLQMNLCDSGIASCYTGRSVTEAAAVIRAAAPDVVTLNEICGDDVAVLGRSLAAVHPGRARWAFQAALDRRTGGPFRCRNGQPYGVGLLLHLAAPDQGYSTHRGIYPRQDSGDPEERAWLCVGGVEFYACTTHLASTSPTVALAQCAYLFGTAIPSMRTTGGYRPTVLGGDLNLADGGSPDLRSCLPPAYPHADDGGVQQVVATTDVTIGSTGLIDMDGTTDHPALLVALTLPRAGTDTG
jgi:endonuclease/exonuclease/phosphatase family metal-dependent hydrolase